jgi:hypothetical protein
MELAQPLTRRGVQSIAFRCFVHRSNEVAEGLPRGFVRPLPVPSPGSLGGVVRHILTLPVRWVIQGRQAEVIQPLAPLCARTASGSPVQIGLCPGPRSLCSGRIASRKTDDEVRPVAARSRPRVDSGFAYLQPHGTQKNENALSDDAFHSITAVCSALVLVTNGPPLGPFEAISPTNREQSVVDSLAISRSFLSRGDWI